VRTSSVAARSARPPHAHNTACAIGGWSCGPRRRSDEGCAKRLTQGCGSTLETSKTRLRLFSPARKHRVGKVECLAFQRAIPNLLNPTTSSGPQDPRPGIQVAYLVSRSRMANRPPSPPPTHPSGCKYRETKRKYVRTRRMGCQRGTHVHPRRTNTRANKNTHTHTQTHTWRATRRTHCRCATVRQTNPTGSSDRLPRTDYHGVIGGGDPNIIT
jgi:hypothetical protein